MITFARRVTAPDEAHTPRTEDTASASKVEAPSARSFELARNFTRELSELLHKEHGAMVDFILALAEFDGRRLWVNLGYGSLFDFLHRELRLSRSAAYYRSAAVGLVQRHPELVVPLADGRLCLTSLAEIGKVITPENAKDILPRFFHRSSREAREVAAEIAPVADPTKRDIVTVVPANNRALVSRFTGTDLRGPVSRSTSVSSASGSPDSNQFVVVHALGRIETGQALPAGMHPVTTDGTGAPGRDITAARRDSGRTERDEDVRPLTAELRRIHITVSKRWVEKLEQAKAALSHSIPSGSAEQVIEAAFDALLARDAKRKGLVRSPRKPSPSRVSAAPVQVPETRAPVSKDEDEESATTAGATGATGAAGAAGAPTPRRHRDAVPAHIRRDVLLRDEGRCQAKLHDGTICGSKVRLQLDHIRPVALGGPSTVENLRLVCERHNQLAARKVFGDAWMDLFGRRNSETAGCRPSG